MENMTFYDFITFVIDFIGVRSLFENSFHRFLKHRKQYDFYDFKWSAGHTYDPPERNSRHGKYGQPLYHQYILCWSKDLNQKCIARKAYSAWIGVA